MSKAMAGEWTRRQFVAGLAAAGVVAGGGVPVLAQSELTGDAGASGGQ
jgi:carbonic anhydrase